MEQSAHVQSAQTLSFRVRTILHELKDHVSAKYPLKEMRLFGSTARGDTRQGSDLDIFLRLPSLTRAIEEDVYDMAYE